MCHIVARGAAPGCFGMVYAFGAHAMYNVDPFELTAAESTPSLMRDDRMRELLRLRRLVKLALFAYAHGRDAEWLRSVPVDCTSTEIMDALMRTNVLMITHRLVWLPSCRLMLIRRSPRTVVTAQAHDACRDIP